MDGYYPLFRYFVAVPNISEAGNVWVQGPTYEGTVVYSILIPIVCTFGIIGNSLSLVVLSRKELKGSVYVYLSALAFSDCVSSILMFISGLSCGVLYNNDWSLYKFDVLLGLPLSAMFNTMAVLTTVMVSIDRVSYLRNPLSRQKPRFCHSYLARRITVICFIFSILVNIPYLFIFQANDQGELTTLPFFYTQFYKDYNWIRFICLGIIPSFLLIITNGYIIYRLQKIRQRNKKCLCSKAQKYTNLTFTMVFIVFCFLISEIPSMLTNRTAASTFFFAANSSRDSCNSKSLENLRQVVSILSATSLSADFILYYLFCPPFCKVLGKICSRRKISAVQMNVYVLDNEICLKKTVLGCQELLERNHEVSSIYDGSIEEETNSGGKASDSHRETLMSLYSS